MVRKEQNKTLNNCFDVHLIPPIRIRNGLPVIINISLLGQDIEFLQDKAEEKHISFYSPEEVIQLSVKLDGYEKEPVAIKFLKKSYEKHIKLQSMDNKYSTLNLYANFSDEKAGCFITFYCKTCFINACSMPLNIYNTTTVSNFTNPNVILEHKRNLYSKCNFMEEFSDSL